MTDEYGGRKPKDYTERYEVVVEESHGVKVVDVVKVGMAFSVAFFVVKSDGTVYERQTYLAGSDVARVAVDKARALVYGVEA